MPALLGVFFDAGNTLVVEEPGKHLWEMAITPLPGALEVLAALKSRYRLGVISNTVGSGDAELAKVLEQAGMRSLIDALVTSRDFGKAKPEPAKPWFPLTVTMLLLFGSLGGNAYLGWLAKDFYNRYKTLAEELREPRPVNDA